jgi:hypothetical protein
MTNSAVQRARLFLATHARLIDRLRFSYLFDGGSSDPIVSALRAYQNADGGFGHALEPDLRGPESEPIPVWTALGILDETDRLDRPAAAAIVRYLRRISLPAGGVPFVHHAASASPHAPWWETDPGQQPANLNPTAGICGLLYKNHLPSAWLTRAAGWCWRQIEQLPELGPYEARVVLHFLDHAPDRRRAAEALDRLGPSILRKDVVDRTSRAKGHVHRPLDLSPEPGNLSRSLFSRAEIERNLDALQRDQLPDGGWPITFPVWTPITKFEWRGDRTVEALRLLRSNGRLPAGG